jgi:hypothetical protein
MRERFETELNNEHFSFGPTVSVSPRPKDSRVNDS